MEPIAAVRRSKRKLQQLPSTHERQKSALQIHCERIIESPGGSTKLLHLVQSAVDPSGIEDLNNSHWTPLVGVIFRLGKNTTKNGNTAKSEEQLIHLVRACHRRGISVNSGAWFGEHYHRPLIVAAYYGYHSAVRLLVELGALPDLGDGEGRNVWFAALQNPVVSGSNYRLRPCDERTAQVLLDMGVVTNDLGLWRRSLKGTFCYMNGDSSIGSVMLRALMNKNWDVLNFLCRAGGSLTDRDYLELRHRRQVRTRLLPMVVRVLAANQESSESESNATNKSYLVQRAKTWSSETDWSFPPAWKVGCKLCQDCGLPRDTFRTYVVPFLDRDWFYTSYQRPPLLGPSSGERVGSCRSLEWNG